MAHAPTLALPTDHPRSAVQTYSGTIQTIALERSLVERLKALGHQTHTTLFMILLASFQALLARYSGQDDIVVGSPIANRTHPQTEGLIGFFANMLVFRTTMDYHMDFHHLLRHIHTITLEAFAHQDIPFEYLVEKLHPTRDLSRHPLVQVILALQNTPMPSIDVAQVHVQPFGEDGTTAKFDLTLNLTETPDGIVGVVEYATPLFEAPTITRLTHHLQTFLSHIAEDAHQPVMDIPLLSATEREQIVVHWNATHMACPKPMPVHTLFQRTVALIPDRVAVVDDTHHVTYLALEHQTTTLAEYLRHWGVTTEVPVGVHMPRSLMMVVAVLAVLKAGGVYVPLDPSYPTDRLSFMVQHTAMPVVVTHTHLQHHLNAPYVHVICLDDMPSVVPSTRPPDSGDAYYAEQLAYIIYTSGSTGQPKGVQVTHQSLLNLVLWHQQAFHVTSQDRASLVASFGFDASVWELWPYLTSGASVAIAPGEVRLAPRDIRDWLINQVISISFLPTPLAEAVIHLSWSGAATLRLLLTGGDYLHHTPHADLPFTFVNNYGPTESTVVTTSGVVTTTPDQMIPAIGRPIYNTQVYLVDHTLAPAPVGIPGELTIGGVGLACGYLANPALTSLHFIPHPLSTLPGQRLYRTGDVARYRPDGTIAFLGRRDTQIQMRGFRIELGEIEVCLQHHPAVREAVVLYKEAHEHAHLVAYLVPERVADTSAGTLHTDLQHEHVDHWQTLYDSVYIQPDAAYDPTFDITGWISSDTGQPIPSHEMQEWVDATVSRITRLHPQRVLEIGCGTGLLLFRLAPLCEQYWGTDFSSEVIQRLAHTIPHATFPHVHVLHKVATDFSDLPSASFDTMVLNSIIQYFPSIDYLLQVLTQGITAMKSGGHIFLGDIRSLPLLPAFCATVAVQQASDPEDPTQLYHYMHQLMEQEQELVIDPAFFIALKDAFPQISHVQILLKRGKAHNELTRFRYDVILHISRPVRTPAVVLYRDWQKDGVSIDALPHLLMETNADAVVITQVPNARVQAEMALAAQGAHAHDPAHTSAIPPYRTMSPSIRKHFGNLSRRYHIRSTYGVLVSYLIRTVHVTMSYSGDTAVYPAQRTQHPYAHCLAV